MGEAIPKTKCLSPRNMSDASRLERPFMDIARPKTRSEIYVGQKRTFPPVFRTNRHRCAIKSRILWFLLGMLLRELECWYFALGEHTSFPNLDARKVKSTSSPSKWRFSSNLMWSKSDALNDITHPEIHSTSISSSLFTYSTFWPLAKITPCWIEVSLK